MRYRQVFPTHGFRGRARVLHRLVTRLVVVLFVIPACGISGFVLSTSGFTFDGLGRSAVEVLELTAGKPATESMLTLPRCDDVPPSVYMDGKPLSVAAKKCADRLSSKAEVASVVASGFRSAYWTIVGAELVLLFLAWLQRDRRRSDALEADGPSIAA